MYRKGYWGSGNIHREPNSTVFLAIFTKSGNLLCAVLGFGFGFRQDQNSRNKLLGSAMLITIKASICSLVRSPAFDSQIAIKVDAKIW